MAQSSDGDDPTAMRPSGYARLTARERAVLSASATGLVIVEVATTLHLTPEAVRDALASAMAKLRARSKLEAVTIALRAGLIDPPMSWVESPEVCK